MATSPHIAILGGGPIGLEAALYARKLGLPASLYERGRVGEYLHHWGHVRLFSPFRMNSTNLGRAALAAHDRDREFPSETECLTGRQHLAAYLEPLSRNPELREIIHTEAQVLHLARSGYLKEDGVGDSRRGQKPFRILVKEGKNRERVDQADVVLDCTGTYGQHRWMGDGGGPAVGELSAAGQIAYGLEDIAGARRPLFAGKYTLVVGAGYSAATSVVSLAALAEEHSDTWVIWLARGSSSQPIQRLPNDPLRERDRLAVRANQLATRTDGNVEFHNQTTVQQIDALGPDKGFRVTATAGGKTRTWDVDRIIANVGYTPDTSLYRELQVHECYASLGPMNLAAALAKHAGADCLSLPAAGAAALKNPEPNFFILGAKSYGRNSHFLLRTGFEQIRDVFAQITGKSNLDLYKGQETG
jgi:thioredoxin reductase